MRYIHFFAAIMCMLYTPAHGQIAQDAQNNPIEVTSNSLFVDQANTSAVFTGNVLAVQGETQLRADKMTVEYDTKTRQITRIDAQGNVTMVDAQRQAEGNQAIYTVSNRMIVLTGNVLVRDGENISSADALEIDLEKGTRIMRGNVRTVVVSTKGAAP